MTAPSSTYRFQVRPGFPFADVVRVLDHVADLGVSHVYCSPLLQATPGSTHGYDVVDPSRIDAERGGEEGWQDLLDACRERGLEVVVDIVPNHVSVLNDVNPWWWSLLRDGPRSQHADTFDVWWEEAAGRVVLPILGGDLDDTLDELQVRREERRFGEHGGDQHGADEHGADQHGADQREWVLRYHEHVMPLAPTTFTHVELGPVDVEAETLDLDPEQLRRVLSHQHWELRHWRTGADELNYRRFFDVTSLAGVRVEDPDVASRVLGRTVEMVAQDVVSGLRIDHPDGLRDPVGFLERLRSEVGDDTWVVVEKILEHGETLRGDWPVEGDVGYRLLNDLVGLLVDPAAEDVFTQLEREVTARTASFHELRADSMREICDVVLVAERDRLARMLAAVATDAGLLATSPEPLVPARLAIRELLVASEVYRPYVVPERDEVAQADREVVASTVARARAKVQALDDIDVAVATDVVALLELLGSVMVLDHRSGGDRSGGDRSGGDRSGGDRSGPDGSQRTDELVARLQQASGPVLAKGIEDTTFYRDVRLVALDEVGGDPASFGVSPLAFHANNAERQRDWPTAMVTTSTHDTKRSEDARARVAVLSQVPDAWQRAVAAWRAGTPVARSEGGPGGHAAYLAWQNLVAAWPIDADRTVAYLTKATREAKLDTTHLDNDAAFEQRLEEWARALVDEPAFVDPLTELLDVVRPAGRLASLAQVLLRCTVPGVPDTYQGNEGWDLSLVDPDNRRGVEWTVLRGISAALDAGVERHELVASLFDAGDPGLAKTWVLRTALRLRRRLPEVFGAEATYEPLEVAGPASDGVVAFLRGDAEGPRVAVVASTRPADWLVGDGLVVPEAVRDSRLALPAGVWDGRLLEREVNGGEEHSLAAVLDGVPIALLVRRG